MKVKETKTPPLRNDENIEMHHENEVEDTQTRREMKEVKKDVKEGKPPAKHR